MQASIVTLSVQTTTDRGNRAQLQSMKQTARSSNISLNSTNLFKLAKTLPYDAIHQKLDSGSRPALRSLLGSVWCLNKNQRSIGILSILP